jgi:RNA polymerase sigma-70 factor (ECF subfamily)
MNEVDRQTLFSELVTRHQSELYSYIFAIVRNWDDADDLLQSVCLVLWQKFESFQLGSNFLFWATRTAKIVVSNHLRTKSKRSSNSTSDELLDALIETTMDVPPSGMEQYLDALRSCRNKLSSVDQQLVTLYYAEDLGSRGIADRLERSQPSLCNSLNRIRSRLFKCIQAELAQKQHSMEDVQ